MGFNFFPQVTSRYKNQLLFYSWLILFLIHGNYFCLVVSTTIGAEEQGTKQSTQVASTTSTVRPWPSHEFLQNVIKTAETVAQSTSNPPHNTSTPQNTSLHQQTTQTNKSIQRGANATVREITLTADFGHANNGSDAKDKKLEIIKEIKDDIRAEIPQPRLNSTTLEAKSANISNPFHFIDKNLPTSPARPNTTLDRDYLFGTKSSDFAFSVNKGNALNYSISVPTGKGRNMTILIKPPELNRSSKESEPRWISLLSASNNKKKPIPQAISTTGELPFRVTAAKKKTTNLDQNFYEQLLSGNSSVKLDRTGIWAVTPEPFRADLHEHQDYVDDEHFGWASDMEGGNSPYSTFPTKAPQLTHLAWPFKGNKIKTNKKVHSQSPHIHTHNQSPYIHTHTKSPHIHTESPHIYSQSQHIYAQSPQIYAQSPSPQTYTQFPIITASSIVPYLDITTTKPTPIFPIITQSSVKPFAVANLGPNKIASVHWGSSGANVQQGHVQPPSWTITANNNPQIVPVLRHPTTTTIKFTADVTSTDTNPSASFLSQVFLTPAENFPILQVASTPSPSTASTTASTSTTTVTSTTAPPVRIADSTTERTAAHIWYKPVINHHYGFGPSGPGQKPTRVDRFPSAPPAGQPSGPSGPMSQVHLNQAPINQRPLNPGPMNQGPVNQGPLNQGTIHQVPINQGWTNQDDPIPSFDDDDDSDEEKKRASGETKSKSKHKSPEMRHINFKIWNYTNGTLELKNEKKIPSWIFKDFNISDDKVLNMKDLPRAIQRIVNNQISQERMEREGVDRRWQPLPTYEVEDDEVHVTRPNLLENKPPISLNYVLWNKPPKRAAQPHDFLLDTYEQGLNDEMNNYMKYLVETSSQESNWNKIGTYFKQPSTASRLPIFDLTKAPVPSQFPNFEDKDISNLVAVSLILSYLNKEKDKKDLFFHNRPESTISHSSLENLSILFPSSTTSKPPSHLSPFLTPVASNVNERFTYAVTDPTTTTTPEPPSDEDKVWESIKPVLQQFLHRHKNRRRYPSTVLPRVSTTSLVKITSDTNRQNEEESDSGKISASTKQPVLTEKGDLGEVFSDQHDKKWLSKKKKKKRSKKFKKKKGHWEHFGFDFNFDLDFSELIKKKIYSLLALKYAPLVALLTAMLAPLLLMCMPYMMKKWKGQDLQHWTYVYPYHYAYPDHASSPSMGMDPYDNGYYGGTGNTRGKKKGVEVHHHYMDIPLPSSVGYSDEGDYASDYSQGWYDNTKGSQVQGGHGQGGQGGYGDATQQQPAVNNAATGGYVTTSMPLMPSGYGYQSQFFPVAAMPPAVPDNIASSYMNRIREIGRTLGQAIGTQIQDTGNQEAMQIILDDKRKSIQQLLQKWLSLKDSPFVPKYRRADEVNVSSKAYPRDSPKLRKRKKRSLLLSDVVNTVIQR